MVTDSLFTEYIDFGEWEIYMSDNEKNKDIKF
jgi:hypothetical protein